MYISFSSNTLAPHGGHNNREPAIALARQRERAYNKRQVYNRVSEIRSEGAAPLPARLYTRSLLSRLIKLGDDRAKLEILNFPAAEDRRARTVYIQHELFSYFLGASFFFLIKHFLYILS